MNLKGRNFITLKDYAPEEIEYLVDLAGKLKADKKKGITGNSLKGKNIALIFEKPSTRTRCAFVVGCVDEGAHPEYLGKDDIQLGHKESVEDTARVLGRMFDGIEFRGFKHSTVAVSYTHLDVYKRQVQNIIISATYTVSVSALLYLFGEKILGIFTDDASVVSYGHRAIVIILPFYVTMAVHQVLMGAYRGAGRMVAAMMILSLIHILHNHRVRISNQPNLSIRKIFFRKAVGLFRHIFRLHGGKGLD